MLSRSEFGDVRVHVIEPDRARRARAFSEIVACGVHAEIYENSNEFLSVRPLEGVALIADVPEVCTAPDLLERLREGGVYLPVFAYAPSVDLDRVVTAVRGGASDYLQWPFNRSTFLGALARVLVSDRDELDLQRERARSRRDVSALSKREREVLSALVRGLSTKQIADVHELSPRTVEIYRRNLMLKLQAKNSAEVVRIGVLAGLDRHDIANPAVAKPVSNALNAARSFPPPGLPPELGARAA